MTEGAPEVEKCRHGPIHTLQISSRAKRAVKTRPGSTRLRAGKKSICAEPCVKKHMCWRKQSLLRAAVSAAEGFTISRLASQHTNVALTTLRVLRVKTLVCMHLWNFIMAFDDCLNDT